MNTAINHRPVRSLSRGLALIRELNVTGPSSVQQLAGKTGLNRTTCYRLLRTLQRDGFVTVDPENALFGLTAQVRMLSDGVSTQDLSRQAALPPMFALLEEISWPSDFAVFELGSMMIRESTHSFSPFSVHRSIVGRRRPLVKSALGRAVLSAASPALRREMLEIAASFVPEEAAIARDLSLIDHIVAQTRRDGYATSVDETEHGISAIALPIEGAGPVLGSLNIVFFSSAMTPDIAARRYLPNLRKAVTDIEARWRTGKATGPTR
ncbi:MAG TPA: IclR family transcriptional regulator C-terminal domain-containing protein [Stellaceae bacterium]|nr:IclR family transcriptional regulator C-terminal domain-containing protein [Stellaceae bacterium]